MAYFRKITAKNKQGFTWAFTIDLGRDPNTGKRKQITRRGFKTKKEAEKVASQMEVEINNESFVNEKKTLFKDFVVEYMNVIAKPSVKPSTYKGYESAINTRLIPKFGHFKIKEITPRIVSSYYAELQAEELSVEYIQYLHAILKNISTTAVGWNYIKNDFMLKVKSPTSKKKDVNTWSIEECNTFLKRMKLQKDHIHMLYYLAIYTGMRRGELLGLKWENIDIVKNRIYVKHSLYYVAGQGLVLQTPKTSSGHRNISITKDISDELILYKRKKQEQLLKVGMKLNNDHFVISSYGGEPLNPNTIHKQFLYDIKLAKMKRIRFHDLRHTHATIMLGLGENPKVISERLGHSNVNMTLNKYSHITPNMQDASIEKFSNAINKHSNEQ